MKVCIFDTETSGFPKRNGNIIFEDTAPISSCRMMQIALMCFDMDNVMNDYLMWSCYVHHANAYDVQPGALQAHMIPRAYAQEVGIPARDVLNFAEDVFNSVDVLAGHNVKFDIDVVRQEAMRYGYDDLFHSLHDPDYMCTMEEMEEHCKLPKAAKHHTGRYKWPKLEECHSFIYHGHCNAAPPEGAHDAMADLRMTKEIFLWLFNKTRSKVEV